MQEVAEELVTKDRLSELRRGAAGLEKQIGRILAPGQDDHIKPGGHWRLPKRSPASKSKGRDWLVLDLSHLPRPNLVAEIFLQMNGLTFDEARDAVEAIIDSMTDRLKAGESVETPLGDFRIAKRTKPYCRVRWAKLQTLHRTPKRIVFTPNADWTVRSVEEKAKQ